MRHLAYLPLFIALLLLGCTRNPSNIDGQFDSQAQWQTYGIATDSNRNGVLDDHPEDSRVWSWSGQGAFILPNLDDDNHDGEIDCHDTEVNGSQDAKDLALIRVQFDPEKQNDDAPVRLNLNFNSDANSRSAVQWFLHSEGKYEKLPQSVPLEQIFSSKRKSVEIALEACAFASKSWDGFAEITIENTSNQTLRRALLRVSPYLMIPNTRPMEKFFVSKDSTGRYGNQRMLFELPLSMLLNLVKLHIYNTDVWQEMWMQDTMEIGYSEIPGSRMHVVLNAPRGSDRFGKKLLGPDVGFLEVAAPRNSSSEGDAWLDWFGNLEISPPTSKYPWGRIYYGYNSNTGNTLHPDVVSFLEAQELQKPIAIDTGWLFIKHVDEIITFWPRGRNDFIAVVPSIQDASALTGEAPDSFNTSIQERLNELTAETNISRQSIFEIFGLNKNQVMTVPLFYDEAEHGAIGRWSNPVNSVVVNRTLLFGTTRIPNTVSDSLREQIKSSRLTPLGVDDGAYQNRLGNVHCGTNSIRSMPNSGFWNLTGNQGIQLPEF